MVTNLILANAAIFLADMLVEGKLSSLMSVKASLLGEPWNFWQLLTAGFAHDPKIVWHVGFNMFGLWLFGRDVEVIYGRREFLRVYLSLVVLASLAWVISHSLHAADRQSARAASMLGASGAVAGIMVLYVLHFPRRLFHIWGVFPIPAWVLCTLYIAQDLLGYSRSIKGDGGAVAYEAHLAGALFAFVYQRTGWNLGRLIPARLSLRRQKPRPRLRIHGSSGREQDLGQRVDRILEKITREGESSLTQDERQTLEEASRRYQERRR